MYGQVYHSVVLLCISGIKDLLLEDGWFREAKSNLVGCQLVVAVSDGGNLVFHDVLVEWVEEDLLVLLTVKGNTDSSSGNI